MTIYLFIVPHIKNQIQHWLSHLLNLIFYSNIWIAVCALAMTLQTQYLLNHQITFTPLMACVFFSTLGLYAIHRLTGLQKVTAFAEKGRYLVISTFKRHIIFYAAVSLLLGGWFFLQLQFDIQLHFIFVGFISLGYVLPILGRGKRFRDVHYIKIFMIAITWAWVTVVLPALDSGYLWDTDLFLLVIERAFFIFGITLPFDIRDFHIDAHTGVKTIPSYVGVLKTKQLALIFLLLAIIPSFFTIGNVHSVGSFLGFCIAILLTSIMVWKADRFQHDYYFTGLVDGSMVLQFLLVWGVF